MTTATTQRNKRLLFIFAALLFIAMGISGGLLNIAWTYMKDTFQVEVGAIGILLMFATSGSLIAAMSSGTLIGRFGIGQVALGGIGFVIIGFVMIAVAPNWFILLFVILFTYMGRGAIDAGMNNFISANYGTAEMNWLHAAWGIGLTIAPTIMTVVIVTMNLGWQAGYLVIAALLLLFGIVMFASLGIWNDIAPRTATQDKDDPRIESPATFMEALKQPVIILTAALCFFYGGLEIGTGQLVNTLFVEGRNISQEVASLWLSLYWGSFTVGRILLGWIALRISDRLLLRGSLILAGIGAALLMIPSIPAISVIALLCIGSGLAGVFPVLMSQTPARVGKRFAAQSIGFQIGFAGFGGAAVPGIIGFFAGRFNLEFITYGTFVNALIVIVLYETLRRRYPVKVA